MGKSKKNKRWVIKITKRQALIIDVALEMLRDEIQDKPMAQLIGENDCKVYDDISGIEEQLEDVAQGAVR
jgi:hypothetical protein